MQTLCREDFDSGPTSVNEIEPGLWLGESVGSVADLHVDIELGECNLPVFICSAGNLSAALDLPTLERYKITHILTVDVCPLPLTVIHSSKFTVKWIKSMYLMEVGFLN